MLRTLIAGASGPSPTAAQGETQNREKIFPAQNLEIGNEHHDDQRPPRAPPDDAMRFWSMSTATGSASPGPSSFADPGLRGLHRAGSTARRWELPAAGASGQRQIGDDGRGHRNRRPAPDPKSLHGARCAAMRICTPEKIVVEAAAFPDRWRAAKGTAPRRSREETRPHCRGIFAVCRRL